MRELDEIVEAAAARTAEAHGDKVVRVEEAVADVADWLLDELPEAANAAARLGGSFELLFVDLEPRSHWEGAALVEVRSRGGKVRLGKVGTSTVRKLLSEAAREVLGWFVYSRTRYLRPPSPARSAPEKPALELPPPRAPRERPPPRAPAAGEARTPRTSRTSPVEPELPALAREPRGLSTPSEDDGDKLPAPTPTPTLRPLRRRGAWKARPRRGRR